MRTARNLLLALAFVAMPVTAGTMDEDIDYLLAAVADSNCTFTRNGKDYDGAQARDHLQMKRERGRRYYDSVDEFIERIASKSSWSGKPYLIRCGEEPQQEAGSWFAALLAKHRAG
jgi:hypothetical protein